mgnify:CR=1 FL=1
MRILIAAGLMLAPGPLIRAVRAGGTGTGLDTDTGTGTGESTSTSTDEGLTFIPYDDIPPLSCDIFAQDCPEGEKCVPFASTDSGVWDGNKCVPVQGDQAPGEDCTWTGIVEATDDCDANSICWNAELVGDQYVGTCVAQCTGSRSLASSSTIKIRSLVIALVSCA